MYYCKGDSIIKDVCLYSENNIIRNSYIDYVNCFMFSYKTGISANRIWFQNVSVLVISVHQYKTFSTHSPIVESTSWLYHKKFWLLIRWSYSLNRRIWGSIFVYIKRYLHNNVRSLLETCLHRCFQNIYRCLSCYINASGSHEYITIYDTG